jgi:hypothetical protein
MALMQRWCIWNYLRPTWTFDGYSVRRMQSFEVYIISATRSGGYESNSAA